jgi:hypothetical protein
MGSTEPECSCKVGRVADRYGLDGLHRDLEQRYVTDDASLRDLAAYFNTRVVGAVVDGSSADVVGDPSAIYRALRDGDVPPERRANVRDQLTYADVDVDAVTQDFVSHQTVRAHLRECLEVDTARSGVDSLDEAGDVINWAQDRDAEIIDRVLERLGRLDLLATGELEVSHTVRITCLDCGETYRPETLLTEGECGCATSSSR